MAADYVRITLRIPRELHAQAVDLAKKTDRSLNGQMVQLMKLGVAQLAPNNEAEKQADLKHKDRA
jgi:hypothetical protein